MTAGLLRCTAATTMASPLRCAAGLAASRPAGAAPGHPSCPRRRRLRARPFATSASSSSMDLQAESNTWCRREEDPAAMEAWARPIVEQILDLYRCRPRPEIFELYAQDAVFDDPAGTLRGRAAIRVAMEALPKIFASGEPRDMAISYHPALVGGERNRFLAKETAPRSGGPSGNSRGEASGSGGGGGGSGAVIEQVPPQVRIAMVQTYALRRPLPFLPQPQRPDEVALPTVALLSFDPATRLILRHDDLWWGQPTQATAPLLGTAHGLIKRVNGRAWEAWGRRRYPES